jgi:hypothetical protein
MELYNIHDINMLFKFLWEKLKTRVCMGWRCVWNRQFDVAVSVKYDSSSLFASAIIFLYLLFVTLIHRNFLVSYMEMRNQKKKKRKKK